MSTSVALVLPKPYYEDDHCVIYHGDSRAVLEQLEGITAIVADPPYGISLNTNYGARKRGRLTKSNDYGEFIIGDTEAFDPTYLLGYSTVVLFGANHYANRLPPSQTWLVWDKLDGLTTTKRDIGFCDQADLEMAWVNKGGPARIFRHRWMGMLKASEHSSKRCHPTQKPVALMNWVLRATTTDDDLICDPYMGSGSTLRAAKDLGRKAIGIEIEERYCEIAAKRLAQETLL